MQTGDTGKSFLQVQEGLQLFLPSLSAPSGMPVLSMKMIDQSVEQLEKGRLHHTVMQNVKVKTSGPCCQLEAM